VAGAPLRRAAFRTGDAISTATQANVVVDAVAERDGLRYYICNGREIAKRS
jgi:hypothetical protein